jgi:DNA primase
LQKAHTRYLERRGYDPAEIERVWGIYGIGAVAIPAALRWRILIPIYLEKRLVSYTCRALAETKKDKYRACPQELEVFHHKDTLYGLDLVSSKNLVVVEGPTDVWRIGPGAVATFGTQVSYMQRLLISRFKRVYVLYDADEYMAGQMAGERLGWEMSGYGVEVVQIILPIGMDPGGMSSGDVKHLRKQLGI